MSEKASKNNIENKELQDLIDQRIEQKKEEIKKEAKKEAKKELQYMRSDSNRVVDNSKPNGISRREFLKKAGLGSVGLAALGLSPASALNLKSDSLSFSDNDYEYLSIDTDESSVEVDNADLDLKGNSLENVGELELPNSDDGFSEDNRIWIENDALKVRIKGETFTAVSAIPGVIEDFSDGNLGNYGGATADFSVENDSAEAYEGEYYLRGRSTGGFQSMISSTEGLPGYPKEGDEYVVRIWWDPDSGARDCAIAWFTQDESDDFNCHKIKFSWDNSHVELREYGGSGTVDTDSTNPDNYNAEWHTVRINIGDSSTPTEVSITDSNGSEWATLSAIMDFRQSGGIGFQVNGDGARSGGITGYFDYCQLNPK